MQGNGNIRRFIWDFLTLTSIVFLAYVGIWLYWFVTGNYLEF